MRSTVVVAALVVILAGCGPTLTDAERAWCDAPVNYSALVDAAARLELVAGHAREEQAAAYAELPEDEKVRVCRFAYEAAT
jgi:hypothetical protein